MVISSIEIENIQPLVLDVILNKYVLLYMVMVVIIMVCFIVKIYVVQHIIIRSSSSNNNNNHHHHHHHRHRRRIQSKAPSFNGGPNTFGSPSSSSSSRFGRGSGSSGRGGMNNASGGVITSNATSRNNPMLTNHLQASPHPFGTNALEQDTLCSD